MFLSRCLLSQNTVGTMSPELLLFKQDYCPGDLQETLLNRTFSPTPAPVLESFIPALNAVLFAPAPLSPGLGSR